MSANKIRPVKESRSAEDYLKDRVEYKIDLYSRKEHRYQRIYWLFAGVAAAASAAVPVLINIDGVPDVYPTLLGLMVAILVAIEGLIHPRELWRNYGLISASLREEEMRYSTGTRPYGTANDLVRLVDRVERLISEERSDTILMQTTPVGAGDADRKD